MAGSFWEVAWLWGVGGREGGGVRAGRLVAGGPADARRADSTSSKPISVQNCSSSSRPGLRVGGGASRRRSFRREVVGGGVVEFGI